MRNEKVKFDYSRLFIKPKRTFHKSPQLNTIDFVSRDVTQCR